MKQKIFLSFIFSIVLMLTINAQEKYIKKAEKYFQKEKYEKYEKTLLKGYEKHPKNPRLALLLADFYVGNTDNNFILNNDKIVLEALRQTGDKELAFLIGKYYYEVAKKYYTEECLKRSKIYLTLNNEPYNYVDTHGYLGQIANYNKDYKEAVKNFLSVIEKEPKDSYSRYYLCKALSLHGDITSFDKHLNLLLKSYSSYSLTLKKAIDSLIINTKGKDLLAIPSSIEGVDIDFLTILVRNIEILKSICLKNDNDNMYDHARNEKGKGKWYHLVKITSKIEKLIDLYESYINTHDIHINGNDPLLKIKEQLARYFQWKTSSDEVKELRLLRRIQNFINSDKEIQFSSNRILNSKPVVKTFRFNYGPFRSYFEKDFLSLNEEKIQVALDVNGFFAIVDGIRLDFYFSNCHFLKTYEEKKRTIRSDFTEVTLQYQCLQADISNLKKIVQIINNLQIDYVIEYNDQSIINEYMEYRSQANKYYHAELPVMPINTLKDLPNKVIVFFKGEVGKKNRSFFEQAVRVYSNLSSSSNSNSKSIKDICNYKLQPTGKFEITGKEKSEYNKVKCDGKLAVKGGLDIEIYNRLEYSTMYGQAGYYQRRDFAEDPYLGKTIDEAIKKVCNCE